MQLKAKMTTYHSLYTKSNFSDKGNRSMWTTSMQEKLFVLYMIYADQHENKCGVEYFNLNVFINSNTKECSFF